MTPHVDSFHLGGDVKSVDSSGSQEMQKWYALHVRSRHEKKVASALEQKRIEVSLPMLQVTRQWSDRKKSIQKPVFSGYLFTRISLQHSRFHVLETHGVVRFAGIGKKITSIPDVQMYWLDRVFAKNQDVQLEQTFPVGRHVRVANGPWRGIEGIIQDTRSTSRLVIWIDVLMQGLTVNIDASLLEPLNR